MVSNRQHESRVTHEAARWFMELQTEGVACHADFAHWLRRSPEHVEEFLAITGVARQLDGIDRDRHFDVKTLLESDGADVVRLPENPQTLSSARPHRRARSRWLMSLAAACVIALACFLWQAITPRSESYATRIGEQRSFKLSDSSLIQLNTDSKVELHFSDSKRDIRLLHGEALFTVERDIHRPFRVLVDATTVQALGTQFNVYRSPSQTMISVVEGSVRVLTPAGQAKTVPQSNGPSVASAQLRAGEEASVSLGRIKTQKPLDIHNAIAWRERRLVFREKPLGEIAAEFNRYNSVQLQVEGEAAREPFSGAFAADRPESLVLFLAKDESIRVERRGKSYVIQVRREVNSD